MSEAKTDGSGVHVRPLRAVGAVVAGLAPAALFVLIAGLAVGPDQVLSIDAAAAGGPAAYPPGFSGERAYRNLADLVSLHPRRYPQTPVSHAAALWARDRFAELGLDASVEVYRSPVFFRESAGMGRRLVLGPVGRFTQT